LIEFQEKANKPLNVQIGYHSKPRKEEHYSSKKWYNRSITKIGEIP